MESWNQSATGSGVATSCSSLHRVAAELRRRVSRWFVNCVRQRRGALRAAKLEVIASEFGDYADLDIVEIGLEACSARAAATPWLTRPNRSASQKARTGRKGVDGATLVPKRILFAVLVGSLDSTAVAIHFLSSKMRGIGEPGTGDSNAVVDFKERSTSESRRIFNCFHQVHQGASFPGRVVA